MIYLHAFTLGNGIFDYEIDIKNPKFLCLVDQGNAFNTLLVNNVRTYQLSIQFMLHAL